MVELAHKLRQAPLEARLAHASRLVFSVLMVCLAVLQGCTVDATETHVRASAHDRTVIEAASVRNATQAFAWPTSAFRGARTGRANRLRFRNGRNAMATREPEEAQPNDSHNDCYNANKQGLMTIGKMCKAMPAALGNIYEGEKEFREACMDYLGQPLCNRVCIDLARIFDQNYYDLRTVAKLAGKDLSGDNYPAMFGNKISKYVLNFEDCKECLEQYRCFQSSQAAASDSV